MTKRETLGQRLGQLRRERAVELRRDIDQADVAKAIGLGKKKQPYMSRWENDTTKPSDDILVKLAAFYGVEPGWLRFGTGEKYAASKGGTKAHDLAAAGEKKAATG